MYKKVFILEDDPQRNLLFAKWFAGSEFVIVNNAAMAIDVLKHQKFDLVLLDHDLGGDVYVSSDHPNTGMAVVKSIHESKTNSYSSFLIHSMNASGADNMYYYLKQSCPKAVVMKCPFHVDMHELFYVR